MVQIPRSAPEALADQSVMDHFGYSAFGKSYDVFMRVRYASGAYSPSFMPKEFAERYVAGAVGLALEIQELYLSQPTRTPLEWETDAWHTLSRLIGELFNAHQALQDPNEGQDPVEMIVDALDVQTRFEQAAVDLAVAFDGYARELMSYPAFLKTGLPSPTPDDTAEMLPHLAEPMTGYLAALERYGEPGTEAQTAAAELALAQACYHMSNHQLAEVSATEIHILYRTDEERGRYRDRRLLTLRPSYELAPATPEQAQQWLSRAARIYAAKITAVFFDAVNDPELRASLRDQDASSHRARPASPES